MYCRIFNNKGNEVDLSRLKLNELYVLYDELNDIILDLERFRSTGSYQPRESRSYHVYFMSNDVFLKRETVLKNIEEAIYLVKEKVREVEMKIYMLECKLMEAMEKRKAV